MFAYFQEAAQEVVEDTTPLITNDAIVFGLLMVALGWVFYTSSKKKGFWSKFYKYIPALFMAYFIPAIFTSVGLISPSWQTVTDTGVVEGSTSVYYVASRFLLPAALVLMTLSIDLKVIIITCLDPQLTALQDIQIVRQYLIDIDTGLLFEEAL